MQLECVHGLVGYQCAFPFVFDLDSFIKAVPLTIASKINITMDDFIDRPCLQSGDGGIYAECKCLIDTCSCQ